LINDGEPIVARAPGGPWQDQTFVIVDIETTGFYPGRDQIIEIGAVRLKDGKIIDSFQTFVRPDKEIPRNIQELTGITPNMVKDAPSPEEALQQFLSYAGELFGLPIMPRLISAFFDMKRKNI
jgi:DNA polymerase-3 subunit alpha (Gram-positive type)